jgi:hypothetical protein
MTALTATNDQRGAMWLCMAFFVIALLMVIGDYCWDAYIRERWQRWRLNRRRKRCGWLRLLFARIGRGR